MGFHPSTKRMMVLSLHPGISLEQVRAATSFDLELADPLAETPLPSEQQLRILREEVDPHRYILGRALA
jgi:hypothetical protein